MDQVAGGVGDAAPPRRVVIAGGGIMGAATAFYLARLGMAATVVEAEAVACAASGKAGGFLALNWNDGSPVGPLARTSYQLHKELAQEFGAEAIGYRAVNTLQVSGSAAPSGRAPRTSTAIPSWLDGHVTGCSSLGGIDTTAQVHPEKLTHALLAAAEVQGARLLKGAVVGITTQPAAAEHGAQPSISGVRVRKPGGEVEELPADVAVVAMGPWTMLAREWLPLPPIEGQKYHSIVLQPQQQVTGDCIFTSFRTKQGRSVEPEIYPRPDGSVYACGEPQALEVPATPGGVSVDPQLAGNIHEVVGSLSSSLKAAAVERMQACYLPLSPDGLPVIGRVPGVAGAYVATGHSCWGILNGPATGLGLAELIVHGRSSSVDLRAFDPARLKTRLGSVPLSAGSRS